MLSEAVQSALLQAFRHEVPFVLIFIRGTVIYLSLLILLRIFKRGTGNVSITDMLLMVLLADASQNAMAGEYKTLTDGVLLLATLIFWNFFLDFLCYRFPAIRRLINSPGRPLIENGKIIRENMRREMITKEELIRHLRENGIEDIRKVKRACLESDGSISVVKKERTSSSKNGLRIC